MTAQNTDFAYTRAECVRAIKAQPAGTRFFVRAWVDAPIEGKPLHVFAKAICASVPVSRAGAVGIAAGCLSDKQEGNGARIPCSTYADPELQAAPKYRAFYLFG